MNRLGFFKTLFGASVIAPLIPDLMASIKTPPVVSAEDTLSAMVSKEMSKEIDEKFIGNLKCTWNQDMADDLRLYHGIDEKV